MWNSCVSAWLTVYPFPPLGIVIPPTPKNISLNEVAKLNCTAIATFIIWEVNGQPVGDLDSPDFDSSAQTMLVNGTQNLRVRTLRVTGSSDSNGSNITCVAVLHTSATHPIAISEPALILVQGTCV